MTTIENKFADWLNQEYGRASDLAKALGVKTAVISNVKNLRTPMPTAWFPVITKLTKNQLTFKHLTEFRNWVISQRPARQEAAQEA